MIAYGSQASLVLRQVGRIDTLIEPIDKVTFDARAAKEQWIFGLCKRSLYFELSAQRKLNDAAVWRVYTDILAQLVEPIWHAV
jgi:hypothetical protein